MPQILPITYVYGYRCRRQHFKNRVLIVFRMNIEVPYHSSLVQLLHSLTGDHCQCPSRYEFQYEDARCRKVRLFALTGGGDNIPRAWISLDLSRHEIGYIEFS